MNRSLLYFRIIGEGVSFALNSLVNNKLRTSLSLLGISVGIFAIISIFTVIDSLEGKLRTTVASLGENVIFIQKWPWGTGGEYKWWEYLKRPEPSPEESDLVRQRSRLAAAVVFLISGRKTVKFNNNYVENADIVAVSHDYNKIKSFDLRMGRYFTPLESHAGRNVCVIGEVLAVNLFGNLNPLGKTISVSGRKVEVAGVIKYEGEDIFNMSPDNQVILPLNFVKRFLRVKDREDALIMVKAKEGISNNALMDELSIILRILRKLKPLQEDDFSLNEVTILSGLLDKLFLIVGRAGWIIGGFSILIGGFGIANIMFVSVKERTSAIGIMKALGARNSFILFQFLFEAVFLCIFGGFCGLLLVFGGTVISTRIFDFDISLSLGNIIMGTGISAVIGIISGSVPAWTASRLNPVDAIRSN
ncbi:MAG: ABC transporter permease [Bacteroidetes bacterium]|nr:ABC transporter permease [Bacteroidota bacterium]